jgi:hypothetical protein
MAASVLGGREFGCVAFGIMARAMSIPDIASPRSVSCRASIETARAS